VQRDDREVAEPEGEAPVVERGGDREGHHEEARHPAEQQEPVPERVERDGVVSQT
jgi:hypothetical protein